MCEAHSPTLNGGSLVTVGPCLDFKYDIMTVESFWEFYPSTLLSRDYHAPRFSI